MQRLTIPLIFVMCWAVGCGIQQDKAYAPREMPQNAYAPRAVKSEARAADTGDAAQTDAQTPANSILEARKLVYIGSFTLIVGDITEAQNKTQRLAEELGGYLQSMQERMMIIRVPAARFNETVSKLGSIGSIAKRRISVQDVTEGYMDLSTRLKNAQALAERLRKLLENADVKESLKVEQELARVQLEIDRLEGQLKLLESQSSYATLEITFEGVVAYTPPQLHVKLPISWLSELGLNNLLRFGGRELY